ncbi:Mycobacterium rhizamassiliense ORFan, partial [Mycobacterium rhizamassiliense]
VARRACPRCGFESKRRNWADRHQAAAVCAAVFFGLAALYTVVGVLLAYPWFFVPMLVVVCAFMVDRRMRVRAAIATGPTTNTAH